jgi:hypothetical protein
LDKKPMDKKNYGSSLAGLADWEPFLRAESGLPGPRGNLELIAVVAEVASHAQIEYLLAFSEPDSAGHSPGNSPETFLTVCGVVALGRLLAEGEMKHLARLRMLANDPRWRVREGVAMALQRLGDADMACLLTAVRPWAQGSLLEQRALAAALCESRLLKQPVHARAVLEVLNEITQGLRAVSAAGGGRKSDEFQALRKGLAYCWSVAVAALPVEGKAAFEPWVGCPDPDVRWLLRENLKKKRLLKIDAAWVDQMQARLAIS